MATTGFNSYIQRLLNVREEEAAKVSGLFMLHFMQGIGIALFFTLVSSFFLSAFEAAQLPYVFFTAAVMMVVIGKLYSYLEEKIPLAKLSKILIFSMFLSILGIWLGFVFGVGPWLLFFALAWYRVLYLVTNLEFWGLSSVALDVRQSKRLFGLISAGDIPAKLLGYLAVSLAAHVMELHHLFLVSAGAYLGAMYFINRLAKHIPEDQEHHHHHETHQGTYKSAYQSVFFGQPVIWSFASLSLVAILAITLVDFTFLTEVKERFSTEAELAYFFGLFFAFGKGLTIIIKIFFSGRLFELIGVRRLLLALPASIFVLSIAALILSFIPEGHEWLFVLFAVMMLIHDVLKYGVSDLATLVLYQPLGRHQRLHGHTIWKGLFEPLGLGVASLVLILLLQANHLQDTAWLSIVLFLSVATWIFLASTSGRHYILILQEAVKRRFLDTGRAGLSSVEVSGILQEKLSSMYPEEVIYGLELIHRADKKKFDELLAGFVNHKSDEVTAFALTYVPPNPVQIVRDSIHFHLQEGQAVNLRIAAITAYCRLANANTDELFPFLSDENIQIRVATIKGMLDNKGLEFVVFAGQSLLEMFKSDKSEDVLAGISVVESLSDKNFYRPIIPLLNSDDKKIRLAAIRSAGEIGHKGLLPALLENISGKFSNETIRSLIRYSDSDVEEVLQNARIETNRNLLRKVLRICSGEKGKARNSYILEMLQHSYFELRHEAGNIAPDDMDELGSEQVHERLLEYCQSVNYISKAIITVSENDHKELSNALEQEIVYATIGIVNWLRFEYDAVMIRKAKSHLRSDKGEIRANALEILDNAVPSKVSMRVLPILEYTDPIERSKSLEKANRKVISITTEQLVTEVLTKGEKGYHDWTIATAISASNTDQESLIVQFIDSSSKLISDTAHRLFWDKYHGDWPKHISKLLSAIKISKIMDVKPNGISSVEKVLILKSTELFARTPEFILTEISNILKTDHFQKGEQIFQKGDQGDAMFIIYEGEVSIHDGDHELAKLGRREFFGELALLDPEPRSASASAVDDLIILRLEEDDFFELVDERPEVIRGILRSISGRLRNQNEMIRELRS